MAVLDYEGLKYYDEKIKDCITDETEKYLPLTGGKITGNLTVTNTIEAQVLELSAATPFIDFHFGKSTNDYTSRIKEDSSGHLLLQASNGVKTSASLEVTGISTLNNRTNIYSTGIQFKIATSSEGTPFFIRNDGNNTYFMVGDAGADNFNSLRPFYIVNSTGKVIMENGVSSKDKIVLSTNNKFLYGVNTASTEYALIGLNSSNKCDIAPALNNICIGSSTSTVYVNNNLKATNTIEAQGLELSSSVPFIDFHYNNGTSDYDVRLMNSNSGQLRCQGHFIPSDGGVYTSGISGARWKEIWCTQSSLNSSSDRNVKKDIEGLSNNYDGFYDSLIPVSYRFKDGESGRLHIGFISQDVEEALTNNNLTAYDFAGFCKDIKQVETIIEEAEYDEEGNIVKEAITEWVDEVDEDGNLVYEYGLRYSEFIALNTNQIQKLKTRVNTLEEENAELKATLENVLERLDALENK